MADVCIVGSGLVGLGVANALIEMLPGVSLTILDKEDRVATHQSSHNSGVIHSGLYYQPGSLKAKLCVEGRRRLAAMCEEAGIPYRMTGKLVIASESAEVAPLDELERRGTANGLLGLTRLDSDGIKEIEPHAVGVDALLVPEAGVVDFTEVAAHLARKAQEAGGELITGMGVTAITPKVDRVEVVAGERSFDARALVNCAGLHADRVASLAGVDAGVRIVPFRGEYYALAPEAAGLVRGLIYPVPDPRFPFLGVHFTRRIDGEVEVGPNAVLARGREHYRGERGNWGDFREVLGYRGFRKLAARYWGRGAAEIIRSRFRPIYARSARRLVPAVRSSDLVKGGAGVRAQAVSEDGRLVDDFVIEERGTSVHVLNAPSPGATASLAIGSYIAEIVRGHLER